MKNVLYLGAEAGYEAASSVLAGVATLEHVPADEAAVKKAIAQAVGVLDASMKVRLTDAMIASAVDLRIISCATTGSDHIERSELTTRSIPVRTLREDPQLLQNLTPAAELSWALLLACARRLPAAVEHVGRGEWVREQFPGVMLNGKLMGLVGCGRLGRWMARYAQAFGMRVIGYDPHLQKWPPEIARASLLQVVRECDFLSVHVHLTDETNGLVSRELLEQVKPGVTIINTSRGAVIDEGALLAGLLSGRIGSAGLDVLDGEPDIDKHPLVDYARRHDNLLITPHCGGFSPDAVRQVCAHAAGKIRECLAGGC